MKSTKRSLFAASIAACLLLVGGWTPAQALECAPEDINGDLHINGDPNLPACTEGGDCFYVFTCCKFNGQYVGQGAPCQDGDACSSQDTCDQYGVCAGNADSPNGTPCDDGQYCNGTESCTDGLCGTPSGNPCPGTECNTCQEDTDTCFDAPGTACTAGGNVCLTSQCDGSGTCSGVPNSNSCNDGVFCNGSDTCAGGTCSQHAGNPCLTGGECSNVCDEAGDTCNLPMGTACTTDANACTDDECNGVGACTHANNADPCEDGVFCNGPDTCAAGSCSQHAGDPCGDGVDCTDDVCNEGADNCSNTANDANCDDGLFCNGGESCSIDDDCQAGTSPCDDDNSCTTDDCTEATDTCSTSPLPEFAACDDGNRCSIDDECVGGSCVGGTPLMVDLCPWVLLGRQDPKGDKLRTGSSSDVTGDICGGTVMLGANSINEGDVVSGLATGSGALRLSPAAGVTEDLVSAGGGAKGKPGTVILPYTDVNKLAEGSVTAKNDASGFYDLSGAHPLAADCVSARAAFAPTEAALIALPADLNQGNIKLGGNQTVTITAPNPGTVNVVDIEGIRAGRATVLQLDGGGNPATSMVLRIAGKTQMSLQGSIVLSGGLTPERVLIYGRGKKCQFGDGFTGVGTLFCAGGRAKIGRQVTWDGAIMSGGKIMRIGDNDVVTWTPFQAF